MEGEKNKEKFFYDWRAGRLEENIDDNGGVDNTFFCQNRSTSGKRVGIRLSWRHLLAINHIILFYVCTN